MAEAIQDPFHRELAQAVLEEIEKERYALASGSAKRTFEGTESVEERYADACGYIRGLTAALGKAAEIERRQMGAGVRPAQVEYTN